MPRFGNYIQDHMLLQRAPQRAIVWGYGDPGQLTTLTMNGQIYSTISQSERANAENESIWSVTLDPVSDEGPFDIHVSQPLANGTLVTITIHDVLFGDVWICSGQSNMELTVNMIYNGSMEIENAGNYPKIRLFTAEREESSLPIEELIRIRLNWSVSSPSSVGGSDWKYMSAVCWLYGRMIHEALDGRPIGLVATSWGGTAIEYWMPPKALKDCNITKYVWNILQMFSQSFSFDFFYKSDYGAIESYDERSVFAPTKHSGLYNAMIYPFTRMVIYGLIWYQGS